MLHRSLALQTGSGALQFIIVQQCSHSVIIEYLHDINV